MRQIAMPTLWVQKLAQEGKLKIRKIPGASNPADLGTRFKKCWSGTIVTFGKVGSELRCVQQWKKSRGNILKFSLQTTKLPWKHATGLVSMFVDKNCCRYSASY